MTTIPLKAEYANKYCLVCAYEKPRGVWDGKTGIYVCIECRNAGTLLKQAIDIMKLIRKEQIERCTDDSCDKMGDWAQKFLDCCPLSK